MAASAPADDLATWVDRASSLAARRPALSAFEVRGGAHEVRREVVKGRDLSATRTFRQGGVGIRAFVGRGSGYAHVGEPSDAAIEKALDRAERTARTNDRGHWDVWHPKVATTRKASYRPRLRDHPHEVDTDRILDVVLRAHEAAFAAAPEAVCQGAFGSRRDMLYYADSAGSWVERESILSSFLLSVVVRDGGKMRDHVAYQGGERGLEDYETAGGPEAFGSEVARLALEQLDAVSVPPGRYRAVFDNHLSGLLAHESFGHLTEYDLVGPGWSVLKGRLGERLADPMVTIRDAPVVPDRPKQGVVVPFDEEGTPGRTTTMLDGGVLREYMHARDSAPLEEAEPTGNARALDVGHPPLVRMRNTYFDPGDLDVAEALELVGDGVYLIGGRGGAPRSDGSFLFTANRGYLVEGGKATKPLRMAAVHGNVLDFLKNVRGLTRDFNVVSNFFGGCGKWDQSFMHVGYGGPHVVVDEALVGGGAGAAE